MCATSVHDVIGGPGTVVVVLVVIVLVVVVLVVVVPVVVVPVVVVLVVVVPVVVDGAGSAAAAFAEPSDVVVTAAEGGELGEGLDGIGPEAPAVEHATTTSAPGTHRLG
jgi:hypothetical protein